MCKDEKYYLRRPYMYEFKENFDIQGSYIN